MPEFLLCKGLRTAPLDCAGDPEVQQPKIVALDLNQEKWER